MDEVLAFHLGFATAPSCNACWRTLTLCATWPPSHAAVQQLRAAQQVLRAQPLKEVLAIFSGRQVVSPWASGWECVKTLNLRIRCTFSFAFLLAFFSFPFGRRCAKTTARPSPSASLAVPLGGSEPSTPGKPASASPNLKATCQVDICRYVYIYNNPQIKIIYIYIYIYICAQNTVVPFPPLKCGLARACHCARHAAEGTWLSNRILCVIQNMYCSGTRIVIQTMATSKVCDACIQDMPVREMNTCSQMIVVHPCCSSAAKKNSHCWHSVLI